MSDIDLIRANLRRNPYGALMPSEIVAMCDEIDALRAKVENALDVWRTHNNGIGGFRDACVCVACVMAAALRSAAISGPVDDA